MSKFCCDVILPIDLEYAYTPVSRGVAPIQKLWPNGATLNVRFLGGTTAQKNLVKRVAPQWSEYGNINFKFDDGPNAHIRISFDASGGAWSTVGKDALNVMPGNPTMNLGWVDEAVILHEFGHALGLGHEHQNPEGGIQWNKAEVYDDLKGAPNFWDRATVDYNMFRKYNEDQIHATLVDKDSIMMYPIPNTWTLNDFSVGMNRGLSDMDKEFIAELYPKTDNNIVELPVNEIVKLESSISIGGEKDKYRFEVKTAGTYKIETEGTLDAYMSLYGPNNDTNLITQDDDSGEGRNSKIVRFLEVGEYFVQIRHYNTTSGIGDYTIYVLREAAVLA